MKTIVSTATILLSIILSVTYTNAGGLLYGDPEDEVHTGTSRRDTNSGASSVRKYPPVSKFYQSHHKNIKIISHYINNF
jgi:hypothetical protein